MHGIGTRMRWLSGCWRIAFTAGFVALVSIYAEPQQPATRARGEFEVASIKLSKRHDMLTRLQPLPGGRLVAENCTLQFLIMTAYDIPPSQISGAPSFIQDANRYDIEAKAPAGSDPRQLNREMLQTLLETRFRLKYHWATEQRPVYQLTVNKGGPGIRHTREGSCIPYSPNTPIGPLAKPGDPVVCGFHGIGYDGVNRKVEMKGATIAELANALAVTELRTVVDRTGLSGTFDISLRWASCPTLGPPGAADSEMPAAAPDCGGPSIFTAIKEQLGLKLERATGSVRVMVIDKVDRPSEN